MSQIKDITNKIWVIASKLRGTMDASEYKNYILPFMFYRYLSYNQTQYLKNNSLEKFYELTDKQEKESYIKEIYNHLGYVILPEYTWDNIVSKIKNHTINASDFQDIFDSFYTEAESNTFSKGNFSNVFSDVNIRDTRLGFNTNERAKVLNDIVLMINDIDFKDESGKDIIGDIYEYLIGQFAATAGKKGGEFYTPHAVSQLLAKLVTININQTQSQFRVYDPTMGSGSLLLTVQKELSNNYQQNKISFYGQELNTTTYNLARMNLMMHHVNNQNMSLRCANTLDIDWPFIKKNEIQHPVTCDIIVANPPYSQSWNIKNINRKNDARFKEFGIAPASKADYAFILHSLYHLEKSGSMAIVLPHGVLFRGASEGKIRQNILNENLLDAVIGLPANLFYGTSISTCILVFKGKEARKNKRDIIFIDASREFEKNKHKNKLTIEHIDKIVQTYRKRQNVDKYAYVATMDNIKENDYNLTISRYIDTFEEEQLMPISDITKELKQINIEIENISLQLFHLLSDMEGMTPDAKQDLDYLIRLFKQ